MATLQELEAALVKADAAGNADDARVFANEIRRLRTPVPANTAQATRAPEYSHDDIYQHAANEGFSADDGGFLASALRPVGLTARHAVEGVAQGVQPYTDAVRGITDPLLRATGALGANEKTKTIGDFATAIADIAALPSPNNAQERVVGDIARTMAAAGTNVGGAQQLGRLYQGVANSSTGDFIGGGLNLLAGSPLSQLMSGATAGGAAGTTREVGGGPLAQGVAGAFGGLAGAAGTQMTGRLVSGARARVKAITPAEIESTTAQVLERQGVDWASLPQNIKNGILKEADDVLSNGKNLNPSALERLVDFRRVGATPTRGTLTLDPVQITREQNLARAGANASGEGLHGLARVQNRNNQALIDGLNRVGANSADDAYAVGNRAMNALQGSIDAERAGINQLYSAARDNAGRSAPLNRPGFAQRVNDLLDEAMVGGELPVGVRGQINRIASGEIPFTVEIAEQLKTQVGKLQRQTTDGQRRYALGIVRQALDDAPLESASGIGEGAISAFNQARGANRVMMQRIENSPALKALYEGSATPDDFVQKFIISKNAKIDDVKELAKQIKQVDPGVLESVRGNIAQHLKAAAIGSGTADEVGRFSASNFRRALQDIGHYKLSAFFSPDEVAQLRSVSNVANYTSAQPVGSAVNNSNSASVIVGKGIDLLDRLAGNIPLFGALPTANNVARGFAQRSAQNISPALIGSSAPSATAGMVVSPAAVVPRITHDPSQRVDRDADEYQYARSAALQAGDYDAVDILDEDARMRGIIR